MEWNKACAMNLGNIFSNFTTDMESIYNWFLVNSIKANSHKFEFIILRKTVSHTVKINDMKLKTNAS